MSPGWSETHGARLRRLRAEHRPPLTLADLAGPDVSISLLSRAERGLVAPSLATLYHIAGRLGCTVGEVLAAPEEESRARAERADALLATGDPAGALATIQRDTDAAALAIRAEALLAQRQEVAALAAAQAAIAGGGSPAAVARAELLVGTVLAARHTGRAHAHLQRALDRVHGRGPIAVLALARLADRERRAGSSDTARNLLRQGSEIAAGICAPRRRAAELLAAVSDDSERPRTPLGELAHLLIGLRGRAEIERGLAAFDGIESDTAPLPPPREAVDPLAHRAIGPVSRRR